MSDWPRIGCGCILLSPEHPGKCLFGKRKGSHGAGKYALPGGKLDLDEESTEACIAREIKEETNIDLDMSTIQFVGKSNDRRLDGDTRKHFVTLLHRAIIPAHSSPIKNMEPNKCEGWVWLTYDEMLELYLDLDGSGRLFEPMENLISTGCVDRDFWRQEVLGTDFASPYSLQYWSPILHDIYTKYVTPVNMSVLLICIDILVVLLIIAKIPYTEIDWIAYMQEVRGFLSGDLNYFNLKGDTGPLVYPAGFLYLFSLFNWMTNDGVDLLVAQYIFAAIYILTLAVVLLLYRASYQSFSSSRNTTKKGMELQSRVPIWAFALLILSKRVHSIFVLRMFNDCVALLIGYVAFAFFVKHQNRVGCVLYSLAVSVKMNMLLFAPGVFLVLLIGTGITETMICISLCALIQLILGAPFLMTYPVEYISRAFEFSRIFTYKWTVNYKFISEDLFTSKSFGHGLLICTAVSMLIYMIKWILSVISMQKDMVAEMDTKCREVKQWEEKHHLSVVRRGWMDVLLRGVSQPSIGDLFKEMLKNGTSLGIEKVKGKGKETTEHADDERDGVALDAASLYNHMTQPTKLNAHFILVTLFASNFIGIAFARTLHYQFYSWYFHQVPLLLWQAQLPLLGKLAIWLCIEVCFNVYPAISESSLLLQVCHAVVLIGLMYAPVPAYHQSGDIELLYDLPKSHKRVKKD